MGYVSLIDGHIEDSKCPYCETDNNDFVMMNQTVEYSGIEMSINRQGMLRVRVYEDNNILLWDFEDIINIKYCPLCGRKFNN